MQLDGLLARLSEARSRYGPSHSPAPVAVATSFSGHGSHTGDFSITSTSSAQMAASHLKIEWIRQSAPMPALHKAIEALLDDFWTQEPHAQGFGALP